MFDPMCASCFLELQESPCRCPRCGTPMLLSAAMALRSSDSKGQEVKPLPNRNQTHHQEEKAA